MCIQLLTYSYMSAFTPSMLQKLSGHEALLGCQLTVSKSVTDLMGCTLFMVPLPTAVVL